MAGFPIGGGGHASAARATVAQHNLSVCTFMLSHTHRDLPQPPQVMHKVRKLVSCIEKMLEIHMKACGVLYNHSAKNLLSLISAVTPGSYSGHFSLN
jgi:hypothetical protein